MVLSSIIRTLFFTMVKMGFQIGSVIKNPFANAGDTGSTPGQEGPLEKEMTSHSSILSGKKDLGRLLSVQSQRVGHNRAHTKIWGTSKILRNDRIWHIYKGTIRLFCGNIFRRKMTETWRSVKRQSSQELMVAFNRVVETDSWKESWFIWVTKYHRLVVLSSNTYRG